MAGTTVYLRRGESGDSLIRRFSRKAKKENLMEEIRHPVHGTTSCRVISKPNLKKKYKKQQAERRRIADQRRKERRALKRQARFNKQNKKRAAVQKQRQAFKRNDISKKTN